MFLVLEKMKLGGHQGFMIKVFIVESDTAVREEIKNSIKWEREGYEVAGEASDGELAYPMIVQERPDILITDIKMPFMDGLELSRLVRQELPDIKILIVSGCAEFEYAREAIQIGVEDYLLKPVSSAELLKVLRGVSVSVIQEWEEKELLKKYDGDYKKALTAYRWGATGAYRDYFSKGQESCAYADTVMERAGRIKKQL